MARRLLAVARQSQKPAQSAEKRKGEHDEIAAIRIHARRNRHRPGDHRPAPGGILKGQELINSAKVKNLANDFRVIPTYIYAYQDKFKALPGDDRDADNHVTGAAATPRTPAGSSGNGVIDGNWNSPTQTDESLPLLAARAPREPRLRPHDADRSRTSQECDGRRHRISSATIGQLQIAGMTGTYQVCSQAILGKFVKQLDVQMDDGQPCTGSLRAVAEWPRRCASVKAPGAPASCTGADIDDADPYTSA
jgi:hypothetical protein